MKDTDPYVAVVWSFGNNLHTYLYSKEIEPLKKAIHYAMFFSDYSLGKELGHDLSFIDPIQDLQKRYLAVKHYFNRLGHFQQQSFEGVGRISAFSQWKQTKGSIHFGISSIGEAIKSSLSKKKKYNRPGELQHNEGRNSVASLAIPRAAAQSAKIFGWGRFYLSHPLCLTTKKSRYLKTA